jgi:phenylpyruvate tautomerase PptA (4-oxalocrotonate tautomerase family)
MGGSEVSTTTMDEPKPRPNRRVDPSLPLYYIDNLGCLFTGQGVACLDADPDSGSRLARLACQTTNRPSRQTATDTLPSSSIMPTYQIHSIHKYSKEQKQLLAEAIRDAHLSIVGGEVYHVQVIFQLLAEEDHYLGGIQTSKLKRPQIWIHSRIKEGRSVEAKQKLMHTVTEAAARILKEDQHQILMYIWDIPLDNILSFRSPKSIELA